MWKSNFKTLFHISYECRSFRQRSVRNCVGSIRKRPIVKSQTPYIASTLNCVQGLGDKSLCVRRLQSQQKIRTERKIGDRLIAESLCNFFFSTVSALIAVVCDVKFEFFLVCESNQDVCKLAVGETTGFLSYIFYVNKPFRWLEHRRIMPKAERSSKK